MKTKNTKSRDLLLMGGVAILAIGGGLYYVSSQSMEQASTAEVPADEEVVIQTEEEALRQQEILKGFETSLNNFLRNIDQQVAVYQDRRNSVREMIKPENMRQFEYVAENYGIAKELMEAMKVDMDRVIEFITKSDMSIQTYLEKENPDNRSSLLEQWNRVKSEQSELYASFFELEKSLLVQFDRIFTIFLKSRGDYIFDDEINTVVFQDERIAGEYLVAKREIELILDQEKRLLNEARSQMEGGNTTAGSGVTQNQDEDVLPEASVQPAQQPQPVLLPQNIEGESVGQPILPDSSNEMTDEGAEYQENSTSGSADMPNVPMTTMQGNDSEAAEPALNDAAQ